MIRLKDILLEHPEVNIDINTTLPNKCDTPEQKSSLQNSLDKAVDYWKKRINDPDWQDWFVLANDLSPNQEFLYRGTLVTPKKIFSMYLAALKKVSLVVLTPEDIKSLESEPVTGYIAFVRSYSPSHPEFGKVYARCALANQPDVHQIATMIHEVAHLLFQVLPFNKRANWEKALYNVGRPPRTSKIDFDERESLIRRRLQADFDMRRVKQEYIDEYLQTFFKNSRSQAERNYYCSETEKQSNLAVFNYARGARPWEPVHPDEIVDIFNSPGGLAYIDSQDTSKIASGKSNLALLLDCWISSLGMIYQGDKWYEIGDQWPTLREFCYQISQLVAKLKSNDSANDITPDQRT